MNMLRFGVEKHIGRLFRATRIAHGADIHDVTCVRIEREILGRTFNRKCSALRLRPRTGLVRMANKQDSNVWRQGRKCQIRRFGREDIAENRRHSSEDLTDGSMRKVAFPCSKPRTNTPSIEARQPSDRIDLAHA